MRLNFAAFDKLFMTKFSGNLHEASRQLNVDISQLHRIINKNTGVGLLFIERFMKWCKANDEKAEDYIFLP